MDETLQKLRYKKVRQKLRYLQTELEETKIIYKKCLDKFNTDFAKYLFGLLISDDVKGEIFNVVSHKSHKWMEIFEIYCR